MVGWVVVLALLLCGYVRAGWIEQQADKTVIHFTVHDWIYMGLDPARKEAGNRANAAALRAFIDDFPANFEERYRARYEENPARYGDHVWRRVEVRVHGFSGINIPNVETDLMAIAGENAPDVLYVNFRKSDSYIQQGFLYPLDRPEDAYLSTIEPGELEGRVHASIWPVIRRPGPGGDVHVWAMPYGGALGKVLRYRKDLFDAAGVAYPDASWTWDDLLYACRKIADPGRGIYGIALRDTPQESWLWMSFLWSAGGDVFAHEPSRDEWNIAFHSREAAVAIDFYTRLHSEPWVDRAGIARRGYAYRDPHPLVALEEWNRGRIAMTQGYMDEEVFAHMVQPEVEGMAPVPKGPTGIRAAEINSRMMGLFAGIKEPAVRDAAWEFIRFFDSPRAVEIRTRAMVDNGLGQFVNPRYLRRFGYEELIRLAPPGWADTFEEAIATGKPEPWKHSTFIYDLLDEPLKEAGRLAMAGRLPEDEEQRLAVIGGLLERAAVKARRIMLGEIPRGERLQRRAAGLLLLVGMVAGFMWAWRRVAIAFSAGDEHPASGAFSARGKRRLMPWVLLLPALALTLVWQYVPLLRGSLMAFQDYRLLLPSTWVGVDHFGNILWDLDWWESVWNATRYSLLVVALTFAPPLLLAILLQEIPRGGLLFRIIFYLPAVLSSLVVVYLWKTFYGDTELGLLNRLVMPLPGWSYMLLAVLFIGAGALMASRLWPHGLKKTAALCLVAGVMCASATWHLASPIFAQPEIGFWRALGSSMPEPIRWLRDERTAMAACVIPMLWAGIGPGCLIYLAALKGIPDDFYDSADIDGAGFSDKLCFIVIPTLRPLLGINFVFVFIGAWFHADANILAMTGGQAGTRVVGLEIFYRAFTYLEFGPATAMAWVLSFMLILLTMMQLRMLARVQFQTVGSETEKH